jgi:hypothetical protein
VCVFVRDGVSACCPAVRGGALGRCDGGPRRPQQVCARIMGGSACTTRSPVPYTTTAPLKRTVRGMGLPGDGPARPPGDGPARYGGWASPEFLPCRLEDGI